MNELQYYEEPTVVSGCAGVGIRGAGDPVVPVAAEAWSIGSGATGIVRGVSTETGGAFACLAGP